MEKYRLIKEEYVDEIKSNVKLLKHIKSGARVLLLENDDINKVFSIGFKTPPTDDTGVPHILEHSTLCGSTKFPVKDPFVELLKGSLNTFLNAMTFPDKTIYPVASCNTKDFQNLMEVYMDAVFYPNVYKHEEIFMQEGWHYELESLESSITYNGVVYNEMKGAFSNPEEVILRQARHSLFPNTTYGSESGGDPKYIPTLTYDNFKAFHTKFYSPANSYIMLYGKMDFEERLEWMDKEYLSKFDIVDPNSEIDFEKPFEKPKTEEIMYPVSKDSSLDDKTYYAYSSVIGDYKDNLLTYAFSVLTYVILECPGAPLKQALLDSKIGKDVLTYYDDGIMQPMLLIALKDSKPKKIEEFKKTIHDSLEKLVNEGLDKKAIYAAINSIEFKLREGDYGRAPKGLLYIINSLNSWLYDDNDPIGRLKYNDYFKELREKVEEGYFEDLISKYLINNNHSSYLVVNPSKTLMDDEEKELKEKLDAYKNSLSIEELEKLIENTKALKLYQETPSTKEELDTLPKLQRSDISDYIEPFYNNEIIVNDIKSIEHNIETNGIGYLKLLFDISKINKDNYKYLSLLINIMSQVDTKKYKYQELIKEMNMNTGGISFNYSIIRDELSSNITPYITVDTKYLYGKENDAISLLKEIIQNSSFDSKNRLKEIIDETLSDMEMMIMGSGHSVAMVRAMSHLSKDSYIQEQFSGLSQFGFLKELALNFDTCFDEFKNMLYSLVKEVFRKENLTISYTGDKTYYRDYVKSITESLYNNEVIKYSFDFVKTKCNEGIKVPGQVQFVAKVGLFNKEKYNGSFSVFNQCLSYDYLWIKVRVLGGAYGVMTQATKNGTIYFVSYRDPKLKETLNVYDNIVNFIDNLELSEEDLTKYIIGAVGAVDAPMSPRASGDRSLIAYLSNAKLERLIKIKEDMINTTLEDIKNLKDIYKDVLSQNAICVVGNENVIEENKDIFDVISNPFSN